LAGSRKQEIKDNLPAMLEAVKQFPDYQCVVAGAPGIEDAYYEEFIKGASVEIVHNKTYDLLSRSTAALVTSGTATLETALFNVPQVVCYKTPVPHLIRFAFNHIIKCKYISLVNLIADKEVVQELLADRFSVKNIREELSKILPGQTGREQMLQGYEEIRTALGDTCAPDNAAKLMVSLLEKS
jgi:lipid-A-disaccharide synthase